MYSQYGGERFLIDQITGYIFELISSFKILGPFDYFKLLKTFYAVISLGN